MRSYSGWACPNQVLGPNYLKQQKDSLVAFEEANCLVEKEAIWQGLACGF